MTPPIEQKTMSVSKDVIDGLTAAAQFDWASFLRLVILIMIITAVALLFLFLYMKWRKRSANKAHPVDTSVSDLVSDLPSILRIIERMAEYQQETVYRIMGYISQERLGIITKRYIQGFVEFVKHHKDPDMIQREFDALVSDISHETVSPKVFVDYIHGSGVVLDVLCAAEDVCFSTYKLQKVLETTVGAAVGDAIKESKKVSFVEVNQ